jgi:hypothetical protein
MTKTVAIQQSLDAMGELLIWTDIAAEKEVDFNQWYDTEHMQERASISGFQWSRRYYSETAKRPYLALYRTDTLHVFRSEPYRRAFENISEQAGPIPARSGMFDADALSEALQDYQNVRNSFGAPQESNLSQKVLDGALGSLAQSFGTYNGTDLENALAGKYLGFF